MVSGGPFVSGPLSTELDRERRLGAELGQVWVEGKARGYGSSVEGVVMG